MLVHKTLKQSAFGEQWPLQSNTEELTIGCVSALKAETKTIIGGKLNEPFGAYPVGRASKQLSTETDVLVRFPKVPPQGSFGEIDATELADGVTIAAMTEWVEREFSKIPECR